jgi:hypothetical protein
MLPLLSAKSLMFYQILTGEEASDKATVQRPKQEGRRGKKRAYHDRGVTAVEQEAVDGVPRSLSDESSSESSRLLGFSTVYNLAADTTMIASALSPRRTAFIIGKGERRAGLASISSRYKR